MIHHHPYSPRFDAPRGLSHHGLRKKTNPKRLDLVELISAAARAAHHARDRGFYTVSPEAVRCVEILKQIKDLRLSAQVISDSNTVSSVQYLAKNGNPRIRAEAKSLLDHWRNILSAKNGDPVKNADQKTSCLKSKPDIKRQGREARDTQNKTLIGRQELLELFEAAKKAAKAVRGSDSSSRDVARCINKFKQLSKVPQTLTRDVILTTDIGSRLYSLTEHSNPDISCAAESLLNFWRMILFTTGPGRSNK